MLIKRIAAIPLWFVSTLMAYELAIYVTGGPHQFGPILAGTIALLVAIDPLHRIWPALEAPAALSAFERESTASRTQSI